MGEIIGLRGVWRAPETGVAGAPAEPPARAVLPQVLERMGGAPPRYGREFFLIGYESAYAGEAGEKEYALRAVPASGNILNSIDELQNGGNVVGLLLAIRRDDDLKALWPNERIFDTAADLELRPVIIATHNFKRVEFATRKLLGGENNVPHIVYSSELSQ